MPQNLSVIRCPRCGYEPDILTDTCMRCSAKLEKLCGTCGFSNAVEKNYCDQCGALLTMKPAPPHKPETGNSAEAAKPFFPKPAKDGAPERPGGTPAKPQLEIQPIQDTVSEREVSFRSKIGMLYKDSRDTENKKGTSSKEPFPASIAPQAKTAQKNQKITQVNIKPRFSFEKYKPALFGLAVAATALTAAYLLIKPRLPGFMLKRAAAVYLEKLSSGRYREAYDLLSTNSKLVCSAEDYVKRSKDYYSKFPRWEFKDIEIFTMGQTAAMVKYQLRESDKPWQPDYISFVRENGKWARPYIWTLFEPIDSALARQDYPQALFLAQKLYLTDPIDPRTSGCLCVSEFFMRIYNKSEESCRETLAAAKTYPVGFSPEEIFWYRFYYAESLRFLEKFEPAIKEYDALLDDTRLSMKEQCPLYISRADAFVRLKKYESALDDVMKAGLVCEGEINEIETSARLRFLNGDAKPEAIAFAQRSRLSPDQPPILEARRRELSVLSAKLGRKKAKFLPKDTWLAAHISGPEYRVTLREESFKRGTGTAGIRDIMVFSVNLWTARAKVEKGPSSKVAGDRQGTAVDKAGEVGKVD